MSRIAGILVCLVMIAPVMYAGIASAADEDTQASVYLVFDPETGEFVTVNDAATTGQHPPRQDHEAIDSVADAADASNESPTTRVIGAALFVLLLGGAVWLKRNR